jgi:hypothetical protein
MWVEFIYGLMYRKHLGYNSFFLQHDVVEHHCVYMYVLVCGNHKLSMAGWIFPVPSFLPSFLPQKRVFCIYDAKNLGISVWIIDVSVLSLFSLWRHFMGYRKASERAFRWSYIVEEINIWNNVSLGKHLREIYIFVRLDWRIWVALSFVHTHSVVFWKTIRKRHNATTLTRLSLVNCESLWNISFRQDSWFHEAIYCYCLISSSTKYFNQSA